MILNKQKKPPELDSFWDGTEPKEKSSKPSQPQQRKQQDSHKTQPIMPSSSGQQRPHLFKFVKEKKYERSQVHYDNKWRLETNNLIHEHEKGQLERKETTKVSVTLGINLRKFDCSGDKPLETPQLEKTKTETISVKDADEHSTECINIGREFYLCGFGKPDTAPVRMSVCSVGNLKHMFSEYRESLTLTKFTNLHNDINVQNVLEFE